MTLTQAKPASDTPPEVHGAGPSWRGRVVAVCIALVTLAFLQDPGRIAADTKLDLTVDPWGFLGRSLHLWDGEGFFGQLQNQAYGYLWPMGPFFGVGQAVGLPDWVVQRLWWSLILVTAFLGMYALLRALKVGSGWPQILAGLAYALAVRPQTGLGAVSVEIWPMAVAPWVLVPLVVGSRRGNPARMAALSALAITTAGGVNAVAAGAVLPLAVWWLITRSPGPRRRQLTLWWSGLTVLAITWWLIPLVVLGRYSPPFLDWIESAEFTTSITDPTSALRGADHWVAYLGNASMWKAGWMLATYPAFIAATAVIAALGMAGLAMRSLPHRAFLVGAAIGGLVLVTAGHTGVFSGWGSEQVQDFLDGAGAPLRNVHKFDLILRIALVVGLAHLLTVVWPDGRRPRWKVAVVGLAVVALVASWWPTLSGQLTRGRSYVAMADHWREASWWLNNQGDPGRALIVPGASFAQFVWGRTQDEPLQALGGYPWGVRDAVPLSSAGNIRMLDEVETRLASGRPSTGLAEYLERMGVRFLVVRNDLAPAAGAPAPIRVHEALDGSPGISRVAWFGPVIDRTEASSVVADEGTRVSYPAVEIFAVQPSNDVDDPRAVLRPAATTLAVDGSPESLLSLAETGALGNRAVVLAQDPQAAGLSAAAGVVTDTDRRREITFGYMRDNESATMTAEQPFQQGRPVHDYRVFGDAGPTVEAPGLQFSASSSPSDVSATWRQPRGATPAAAMDGALDTYWRPGAFNEQASYWEVRYPQAIELGDSLRLALMNKGSRSPGSIRLQITTDFGMQEVDAVDFDRWQSIPVTAGSTTFVRISVPKAFRPPAFGIREVELPGEGVSVLELPGGQAGDAVLLTARPGDAGECLPRDDLMICSDGFGRFSQDRAGLFRTVNLPAELSSAPRIWVAPRDTRSISETLSEVAGARIDASSTRTTQVAGSELAAFDRRLGTAWQAAPNDPEPTLKVTLPEKRELRGIRLMNRVGLNASSPLEMRVRVGGMTYTGFTDTRGLFRFDPVVTDEIEMSFVTANQVRSKSELGEFVLPIGISEVGLIGADDLRQPLPADAEVKLPCGTGPDLELDGTVVAETSVTARVEQLKDGNTVPATACAGSVTLPAGPHQIAVRSSQAFQPVLAAFAADQFYAPTTRAVSPEVVTWEATERAVNVPASDQGRVLEVAENFNPGWRATAEGQDLAPVRVDGWKQAFILPAGVGGQVTLTFAPDGVYRTGLVAGLLAVLAVFVIAVRPPRLRATPALSSRALAPLVVSLIGTGVLLTLGPWGLLVFGLAWFGLARAPLSLVAGGGVVLAGLVPAAFGIRLDWYWIVVQGCLLALAWAAVARASFPRASAADDPSASTPGRVAR